MVKRTLSICFLFLSGIILLGHAIIPHQHHLTGDRLVKTAIHHHHITDTENPANHSHEHDGSSTKHFVLEQVVIARAIALRPAPQLASGSIFDFDHDHSFLFIACITNTYQLIIPESNVFRRTDYQVRSLLLIIRDNRLRGPPVA
ncbi:MAG: hypothetical protein ACOYMF_13065 [Bacteroidales bacterium]